MHSRRDGQTCAPTFVVLAAAVAKKSAARSDSLRTETGGQANKE